MITVYLRDAVPSPRDGQMTRHLIEGKHGAIEVHARGVDVVTDGVLMVPWSNVLCVHGAAPATTPERPAQKKRR